MSRDLEYFDVSLAQISPIISMRFLAGSFLLAMGAVATVFNKGGDPISAHHVTRKRKQAGLE
jgi:hypothetical protein